MREINDILGYWVQATPAYLASYEAKKNQDYTRVSGGDLLGHNDSADLIVCPPESESKPYGNNEQINNLFGVMGLQFQAPLMVLLETGFRIEQGNHSSSANLLAGFNLPLCFVHNGELRYLALNLSYVAIQNGQCHLLNSKNQKLMKISDDVYEVLKIALDSINGKKVDDSAPLSINKIDNPDAPLSTIILEIEDKVRGGLKKYLSEYIEKERNKELQGEEAQDQAATLSTLEDLVKQDLQPIISSADYFAFDKEWSVESGKNKAIRQLGLAMHASTLEVKNDFFCDTAAALKGRASDYLVRLCEAKEMVDQSPIFPNVDAKKNLLDKLDELYKKLEKEIQAEMKKGPKANYEKISAAEKIALEHYKMCQEICKPGATRDQKEKAIRECYENSSKDPLWWTIAKVVGVVAIFAAAAVVGFVIGAAVGHIPGGILGAIKGIFTAATWATPVIIGISLGAGVGAVGSSAFGFFAHIGVRKIAKEIQDAAQELIDPQDMQLKM